MGYTSHMLRRALHLFKSGQKLRIQNLCTSCQYWQENHPRPRQTVPEEQDDNKPIQFSTSKAAQWNSLSTFVSPVEDVPAYQSYIVMISLAVFMVYFFILREENDLDEILYRPLHETVPAIEEQHLKTLWLNNKELNLDTSAIEKRLVELEAQKKKS